MVELLYDPVKYYGTNTVNFGTDIIIRKDTINVLQEMHEIYKNEKIISKKLFFCINMFKDDILFEKYCLCVNKSLSKTDEHYDQILEAYYSLDSLVWLIEATMTLLKDTSIIQKYTFKRYTIQESINIINYYCENDKSLTAKILSNDKIINLDGYIPKNIVVDLDSENLVL